MKSTGGIPDSKFYGATVVTARITNVNVDDYSVDVVGEHGGQPWYDIQVSSPYFHYFNGEGIYVMPEVGALCWVCVPSAGKMAPPFILGFQSAIDERETEDAEEQGPPLNFKGNRPALNPGDILLKTRDENFLILRRGGVVQLGSSPISQRIFLPIGNIIRDVCENYILESLAGQMEWKVERVDQADPWLENPETRDPARAQDALTSFSLLSKTNAAERSHSVLLRTGSHKDNQDLRLSLVVNSTGDAPEGTDPSVIMLNMTKAGDVSWAIRGVWGVSADSHVSIGSWNGNVTLFSNSGSMELSSKVKTEVKSSEILVDGTNGVSVRALGSEAVCLLEASSIPLKGKVQVGGPGAGKNTAEPMVKGRTLVRILRELIDGLSNPANPSCPSAPSPGLPVLHPGAAKLKLELDSILSSYHTTT